MCQAGLIRGMALCSLTFDIGISLLVSVSLHNGGQELYSPTDVF